MITRVKVITLVGFMLIYFSAPSLYSESTENSDKWRTPNDLDSLKSVYQNLEKPNDLVRIHEGQFWQVQSGKIIWIANIVDYTSGKLFLCSRGCISTILVRSMGDQLGIQYKKDGPRRVYTRVEGVPKIFELVPFTFGEWLDIDRSDAGVIEFELLNRQNKEKYVRTHEPQPGVLHKITLENTRFIRWLTQRMGWIDEKRFGRKAEDAALLFVQHSNDIPLIKATLSAIKGNKNRQVYAILYDQLQIIQGKKQKYGTQIGTAETGRSGILPVEDPSRLRIIRAQMGLPKLDKYLAQFGILKIEYLECP